MLPSRSHILPMQGPRPPSTCLKPRLQAVFAASRVAGTEGAAANVVQGGNQGSTDGQLQVRGGAAQLELVHEAEHAR